MTVQAVSPDIQEGRRMSALLRIPDLTRRPQHFRNGPKAESAKFRRDVRFGRSRFVSRFARP